MDRLPLYAQFDGDEFAGTRYALGDPIDEKLDDGTVAYLTAEGRIAATRPVSTIATIAVGERPDPATMTRVELLNELGHGQDNDVLRDAVTRKRENEADTGEEDDEGGSTDAPKALADMTAKELDAVIAAEGVEVASNADKATKVAAIEAKRTPAA